MYEIAVRGRLPEDWPYWFDGFTVTTSSSPSGPVTTLAGPVADQAELHGVLARIRDHQGADAALALLDLLRELRQSFPRLRMVFTGSIGLHHVLDQLQPGTASALAPVNDMLRVDLPPLAGDAARDLAVELLAGEELSVSDASAVAAEVAAAAGV